MTIRSYLAKRKKRIGYWSLASFAILVIAAVAGDVLDSPLLFALAIAAFISYAASVVFYQYRVRCPRCSANTGRHTSYFGVRKTLFFDTVNYCPFCGVHLDEPVAP